MRTLAFVLFSVVDTIDSEKKKKYKNLKIPQGKASKSQGESCLEGCDNYKSVISRVKYSN